MKNQFDMSFLKNKNNKIILLILAGILLIVIAIPTKSKDTGTNISTVNETQGIVGETYEEYIENKLEKALGKVQGVGKVQVIVNTKGTSEKLLVKDTQLQESNISETDSSGGTRITSDKNQSDNYLYYDNEYGSEPYVSRELTPEIEGVIVIAQGGDDGTVVSRVSSAIEALLNVPIHKIQVLKMSD